MIDTFEMGRVEEVIIKMPDGNELRVNNAIVKVEIETETLEHFSTLGGSPVRDHAPVVIGEEKVVTLKVEDPSIIEELTRLIRED
jgi:hypothetical protein